MDIKEVEKEYCSRCPSYKYGCGFITRGLQDKCSQLSDYTDGYEKGYQQAEKDLELTYDDICEIMEIMEDVLEMDSYENLYEEILKRFKKLKPDGSQMTKQV